jgi:hypothetical protein
MSDMHHVKALNALGGLLHRAYGGRGRHEFCALLPNLQFGFVWFRILTVVMIFLNDMFVVWVENSLARSSLVNELVVIPILRLILDSYEFALNTIKSYFMFFLGVS